MEELKNFMNKKLTSNQLERAKVQLKGNITLAEENNLNFMLMMGKSLLDIEDIESLDSIFRKIGNVNAIDLQDTAKEMFDPDLLSSLKYLPQN